MSRMSEIHMEITERIADGDAPEDIVTYLMMAYALDSVTAWHFVNDIVEPDLDESMDGDFDSAMASAGFGTDEDYGYFGGDE